MIKTRYNIHKKSDGYETHEVRLINKVQATELFNKYKDDDDFKIMELIKMTYKNGEIKEQVINSYKKED